MTQNDADVAYLSPQRRRRSDVFSFRLLFIVLFTAVVVGCGAQAASTSSELAQVPETETAVSPAPAPAGSGESAEATSKPTEPKVGEAALPPTPVPTPAPTPTPHPVAVADTDLPPAPIGFDGLLDAPPAGPQPISIEIENINVRNATIIPVGVNQDDLSFEVPPADQVGWYEFGSAPGEAGSAVLAAHIAYNGVDGVFRYLENVEI